MSAATTDQPVLIERTDGALSVTLNRPDSVNALSPEMVELLIDCLSESQGIQSCIIRGNGKHFCAGFDLSDVESLSDGDLLWRFLRIEKMLQLIHHAPFPVMALAHGAVIGAGADLFAACWQRVAAPGSRFRMPGWNFDLALGTRRLARLIGADHARDMLIDTRQIDADRAHEIGLATDILPDDEWELCIDTFRARAQVLSPEAVKSMLELTVVDSRSDDLAAIVDTAGRPGLKERILAYRARVQAAKR